MSAAVLQDALRLSERMLAAAHEGRWAELIDLEPERRRLLSECLPGAGSGTQACIARLIELNAEIIALGEAHRDGLMRAFAHNLQQRRAAGAYAGARP